MKSRPPISKPETGDHYYWPEGRPAYGVDLRTAKKQGLYPSPTTVLKIQHNAGLQYWLDQQLLKASFENPPAEGETARAYEKRIRLIAGETGREAARVGTEIHDGIERFLNGGDLETTPEALRYFGGWADEAIADCDWTERVLVNHELGVAGKCDALVTFKGETALETGSDPVIVDWKSQRVKKTRSRNPVNRPNFYSKWAMQLAFYASCLSPQPPVVTVVLNTNETEKPYLKVWSQEEQADAYAAFCHALELWRFDKGLSHNPAKNL